MKNTLRTADILSASHSRKASGAEQPARSCQDRTPKAGEPPARRTADISGAEMPGHPLTGGLAGSCRQVALAALLWFGGDQLVAQPASSISPASGTNLLLIDLPSALQLAGARNLDIQIARQQVAEARANYESATWQFFPALAPGLGYRRHDDLVQNVDGQMIQAHKEAYAVGAGLGAQLDLGEAIYRNLAARQLVKAAESGSESQQQETVLVAAHGYLDLARGHAAVAVARDSVRIAADYQAQAERAVGVGIAFKADALRAQVQVEKNRLALRQAQEQRSVLAARLVQALHLEPTVELAVPEGDLVPLALVSTNVALDKLLAQALAARPELKQSRALQAAAKDSRNGARFGPLIPTLGAQASAGGLGGGKDGLPGTFGATEDYSFTATWRIGPGGLFDRGRIRAAEARLNQADLLSRKLVDEIARQVIESYARLNSMADQVELARRTAEAAAETLRLTQQRKEFAVGVVLENILAEQDLTRARLDYLTAIAEFNKVQYSVQRAVGGLGLPSPTP
jgi:outer membrane protein TolC